MQMFSSFSQGLGDTVGMRPMNAAEKLAFILLEKPDILKCSFLILSLGLIGYGCKFRRVLTKVKQ